MKIQYMSSFLQSTRTFPFSPKASSKQVYSDSQLDWWSGKFLSIKLILRWKERVSLLAFSLRKGNHVQLPKGFLNADLKKKNVWAGDDPFKNGTIWSPLPKVILRPNTFARQLFGITVIVIFGWLTWGARSCENIHLKLKGNKKTWNPH